MISNLRLVNKTITNSDSNLPSGKSVTIPASSTANGCATDSSACDDVLMTLDTGNTSYGVYYNWYTATATYGTYSMSSGSVSYDICPKGWRLPTGGSSGEFQTLYSYYNSSALMRGTPAFVISGGWNGASVYGQGDGGGYYWSSTAYDSDYAHRLDLVSSYVRPESTNRKYYGFAVRCLAR